MKIAVTGANGYIGSHIVKELLDYNHKVTAVDFNSDRIDKRADFLSIDIFNRNINIFETLNQPDVVLHFACKDVPVHNSLWHIDNIDSNFYFVKNLIDNGLKYIITAGSMHDIGYFEGKMPEDAVPNPQTFYGISKNTLRQLIEVYIKDKNVHYSHLRFFYTHGDDEQSSGSIFSKILQMSKEGKKTLPFTDGKNQFDYININELAKQVRAVAEQTEITGIINCCSGKPTAIKDQVEWFIKTNKLDIAPEYGAFPSRPYDSPCIYGDNAKITKILNKLKS